MRANIGKLNTFGFKGYDACPIKNLYMEGITTDGQKYIYRELKDVGSKENFDVLYYDGLLNISSDNNPTSVGFVKRWAQDNKAIIQRKGVKTLISRPNKISWNYRFIKYLESDYLESRLFSTGGNTFIGKKSNGEKWALVGADERITRNLEEFCKTYDIKPENVHILSQPNFHLDMAIRPVGYPFVLVNDEKIAKNNVSKYPELRAKVDNFYETLHKENYASCEKTITELKAAGFVPIRIGGVYTKGINYMNAIVNQHDDGTISYITNSAKYDDFERLDKIFKWELEEKAPALRNTYFISGGKSENRTYKNAIMEHLGELQGGIHCLTLEEPDFERWV